MAARDCAASFTHADFITISDEETKEEDHIIDVDGLCLRGGDDDLDENEADEAYEDTEIPQGLFNGDRLRYGQRFVTAQSSPAGFIITPGATVEISERNFFHVKHLIRGADGHVSLLGFRLVTPCDIEFKVSKMTNQPVCRVFPQHVNELVAVLRVEKGKLGKVNGALMLEEVPLLAVTNVRNVIFTNTDGPTYGYQERGWSVGTKDDRGVVRGQTHTKKEIEALCDPVVRMKWVEEFDTAKNAVVAWQAAYLRADECSPGRSVPDELKSLKFLGPMHAYSMGTAKSQKQGEKRTKRKTSMTDLDIRGIEADLTKTTTHTRTAAGRWNDGRLVPQESVSGKRETMVGTATKAQTRARPAPQHSTDVPVHLRGRVYKFGDLCAGLGCVSRAAKQVGLRVKWVLDSWDIACRNLEANFPRADCFEMSIPDFPVKTDLSENNWVEVIHFSPPCQGHSHLNRGTNPEQDAINNAVGYALGDVLKCRKPRRMTMEQTRGIMTKNEGQHFRQIINMFLNEGYSVRWTVLYAWDYGEVQRRPRFFALASCPGESLADFPAPTHGPGLQPYVTINERLATIDARATHHDPAAMRGKRSKYPVADGDKPLTALMNTNGIQFRHPSGQGWFTPREHLALMGLPNHHKLFYKTQRDWTTLCGNGVPVGMGAACLKMVVMSLRESDAEQEAFFNPGTIVLDGDDVAVGDFAPSRPRKSRSTPQESFDQPAKLTRDTDAPRNTYLNPTPMTFDDDGELTNDAEPPRRRKRRPTPQETSEPLTKQWEPENEPVARYGESAGSQHEDAILIPDDEEDETELVVARPSTSVRSRPASASRSLSTATFGRGSPAVYDLSRD